MSVTQEQLINSIEFENALNEGAECKKNLVTTYKQQNRQNFDCFEEIMINANQEVKKILETKKKKRTDVDKQMLDSYKKTIRNMYNQVQALTVDEHLEDNKKNKIEKIVDKIVPVLEILRYIGKTELDKEFAKHGIIINSMSLECKYPELANPNKQKCIIDIFNTATKLKQQVVDNNEYISEDLFTTKVPIDLQYDKGSNNVGLKSSDWKKLVDAKTKLIMATSEEAKEKAEEKIEHIASEKQFEAARAELVRDKLTKL